MIGICTFCKSQNVMIECEYYPHEGGGYCIFMPRSKIEYACKDCNAKHYFILSIVIDVARDIVVITRI